VGCFPRRATGCRIWTAGVPEHPAGANILSADLHQVAACDQPPARDEPACLPQPQPVDRVADAARVGEPRLAHPEPHVLGERLPGGGREPVLLALQHQVRDLEQFVQGEAGEVDVMGDPGGHARVGPEEGVHPVRVAGQDHHQVLPVRLHELKQDLDRLLAVVALILRAVQVVRLVDEEHPAHRPLEHLLGLRGGVAHVLADQVVPGHADQLALAQVAELAQQLAHVRGHRGLARAGAAGEAHVQARPRRSEPVPAPEPVDEQQRGDLADPVLDRCQANELGVQPAEHLRDPQRLLLGRQIHGVIWRQRVQASRTAPASWIAPASWAGPVSRAGPAGSMGPVARPPISRRRPRPRHGEAPWHGLASCGHESLRAPFGAMFPGVALPL